MSDKKQLIKELFENKASLSVDRLNGYLVMEKDILVYKTFKYFETIVNNKKKLEEALVRMPNKFSKCIDSESRYYAIQEFERESTKLYSVNKVLGTKKFNNKEDKKKYKKLYQRYEIGKRINSTIKEEMKFLSELKEKVENIDLIISREIENEKRRIEYEKEARENERIILENIKKQQLEKERLEKERIRKIKDDYQDMLHTLDLDLLCNYKLLKEYKDRYKVELGFGDI